MLSCLCIDIGLKLETFISAYFKVLRGPNIVLLSKIL